MKQHRRSGADDAESGAFEQPRHRVPRFGAHPAARGPGLFRAPVFLLMIAFFGIGIVYHVYQFSLGFPEHPPLREPFYNKTMVEFTTKHGKFTIDLFPEHAPKTVEAFMKLIDSGFYSDKAGFYRNEPNFILQGGGFLHDKESPFGNLPVEYSLPSTERMVVLARSHKADSGTSEFAIMLHDNSEVNRPSADSPGYTVFGRVVHGWHTIRYISKKMKDGYLPKESRDRQIAFEKVEYVQRLTNDNPEARKRLEELHYVLENPHTVNIISEFECPEMTELKNMFTEDKVTIRIDEIGYSNAHPYEHEAIQAISGTTRLPLVYINDKLIGGVDEVKRMKRVGTLDALLERSGALAEKTAFSAIRHHPVVIFSKSYCPYCKKVKEIFAGLGVKPVVFELDLREDGPAIQDFLWHFTGRSTVPNVFIRGKTIGGADDTAALLKSGELVARLKKAGVVPRQ